jgi:zinc/manganese transport system substrate-binding protein
LAVCNSRRALVLGTLPAFVALMQSTWAAERLPVVASFSILGDLVANVGGDRIDLSILVGPDGDAHAFDPSPADARRVAAARIVIINGLGFEGWISRLADASGATPLIIEATKGLSSEMMEANGTRQIDPHAWQSVANARIMVANIRDGLIAADPGGTGTYKANALAYVALLDGLQADIKAGVARIPAQNRRIITSHDAFGYFAKAYGMTFIAPQGVSTEAEASAKGVARIIRQIRQDKIPAVFLENIADPRLMARIAEETGAKIGGTVFSDALSKPGEGGATYIEMMRHNLKQFEDALATS